MSKSAAFSVSLVPLLLLLLRIVAVSAGATPADHAIPSALKYPPPLDHGDGKNDQHPAYTMVIDSVQPRWKNPSHSSALIRVDHAPLIVDLTDVIAADVHGFRNGEDVRDYGEYYYDDSHSNNIASAAGAGSYVTTKGRYDEIKRPFGVIRRPVESSTAGWQGIGFWTAAKIGLAKLKAFKAIKLLLVLLAAVKLKLLFAFLLLAKLLVAGKTAALNLLLLPFFFGFWSRSLLNAHSFLSAFSQNTTAAASVSTAGDSKDTVGDGTELKTFADQSIGATFVPKLVKFVTSVQSARCVERTACHAASFTTPGFGSIWLSGILPSFLDYIPYKKLKLYMTTFKKVSDIRLEEIFIKPSTEEWLKWCDGQYQCKDKSATENDN